MSNISQTTTKLNGSNYLTWKFSVQLLFDQHEVKGIALVKEIKPNTPLPLGENPTSAERATHTLAVQQNKQWLKQNSCARLIIYNSVEEGYQQSLTSCDTAHDMWKQLMAQHEQHTQENEHSLLQKFYQFQFQQDLDVIGNITIIRNIATQLRDINRPLSDSQVITKIICVLPTCYRHVASSWENLEDDKKTLPLLISRLTKEEIFLAEQKVTPINDDSALIAKGHRHREKMQRRNPEEQKGPMKKHPVCNYCKDRNQRFGHREDDCWRKAAYLEGQRDARAAQANTASSSHTPAHNEEVDYGFVSLSFFSGVRDGCWYADSGASHHMTDQRDAFSSFRAIANGTWPVTGIGSTAQPLFALGVGSVAIKAKVNETWHDAIISDVLFVPHLGINLFSIGAAADKGIVSIFDRQTVRFEKAGKTVASGTRANRKLYELEVFSPPPNTTSTIEDSPAHTQSGIVNPRALVAATSLHTWHLRFGHINTSTIKNMAVNGAVTGLKITTDFT